MVRVEAHQNLGNLKQNVKKIIINNSKEWLKMRLITCTKNGRGCETTNRKTSILPNKDKGNSN